MTNTLTSASATGPAATRGCSGNGAAAGAGQPQPATSISSVQVNCSAAAAPEQDLVVGAAMRARWAPTANDQAKAISATRRHHAGTQPEAQRAGAVDSAMPIAGASEAAAPAAPAVPGARRRPGPARNSGPSTPGWQLAMMGSPGRGRAPATSAPRRGRTGPSAASSTRGRAVRSGSTACRPGATNHTSTEIDVHHQRDAEEIGHREELVQPGVRDSTSSTGEQARADQRASSQPTSRAPAARVGGQWARSGGVVDRSCARAEEQAARSPRRRVVFIAA